MAGRQNPALGRLVAASVSCLDLSALCGQTASTQPKAYPGEESASPEELSPAAQDEPQRRTGPEGEGEPPSEEQVTRLTRYLTTTISLSESQPTSSSTSGEPQPTAELLNFVQQVPDSDGEDQESEYILLAPTPLEPTFFDKQNDEMDVTTLDSKLREMGDSDSGYGSEDASLENGLALQVTITDDTPKRLLNSDHPDWSERAVAKSGLWIVGPCYNFEEFFGKQKHRRMLYRCPEGDLIYNRKAREVAFKPAAIRDGSGGEDGSEEDESEGEEQTGWGVRHRKYAGVQFLAAELSRTRLYAREHGLRSTGNRCDWRLSPLRDLSNKGPLLEVTSPEGETRYLIPPAWDTTAVIGGDKDAECGGGRYRRYWSTKHLEPEQSRTRIHVREHGLLSMGNQCDWRRSVLRDPFNQGPTLEVTDPEGETRYLVPPAWDSVSVWDNDDEGDDWEDDEDEQ